MMLYLAISIRDERTSGFYLSMVMPIVIFQKNNAIHLGTVLIVIDPNIRLYPAIKLWPVPSETGEALLVHRDGNEVVYLNELRHSED